MADRVVWQNKPEPNPWPVDHEEGFAVQVLTPVGWRTGRVFATERFAIEDAQFMSEHISPGDTYRVVQKGD